MDSREAITLSHVSMSVDYLLLKSKFKDTISSYVPIVALLLVSPRIVVTGFLKDIQGLHHEMTPRYLCVL